MKSGKRALLYLMRKKGRTILLLLFLFIIASLLQIGGSLKSNADLEEEKLRKSLGSGFVLKSDTENEAYYELRSEDGHAYNLYVGPRVTDEMISRILKIKGVEDYDVTIIDLIWTDLTLKAGQWSVAEEDAYFTKKLLELLRQETQIIPCRNGELNKNFWTGAYTISEGRNIQEGDHYKAVISDWLANENRLTVGDSFTVETKEGFLWGSKDPLKTLGEPLELEIVGLFHPNFKQEESDMTYEDGYVVNMIYTDLDTHASLQKNIGEEEGDGYTEVTFFVEDPSSLDSVMQQIREDEKIDIEGMIFKADDTAYQSSAKPFRHISLFSTVIMVTGAAGIGIILYLLLKLWTKERTREAGILLCIGIKKREIVGQMLLECFLISAIALLLSVGLSGGMVKQSTKAAEWITSPKTERETYTVRLTHGYNPQVTKNSSGEVRLSHEVPKNVTLFTVFGVCGISCLSVLLSSVWLLDMEPGKLLQTMGR